MLTLEEKKKALSKYINNVKKELGDHVEMDIATNIDLDYKFMIPPIPSLAMLMGRDDGTPGGFPKGKITVIAGPEKSGKTTLCLQTLSAEMEANPDNFYVWVDTENSFDKPYAESLGIDFSRLIFIRNGIMHDILNRIIELSNEGVLSGVILDSVGGLTPKEEIEDSKGNKHGIEKDHMLNLQRKMGQFLRMINPFIAKWQVPVVLIAHVYQDPSAQGAFKVKGGNALKHWGHVRLMMSRLNDANSKATIRMPDGEMKEVFTGHDVVIKLDKTRQNSKESQSVVIPYRYGIGLDAFESTISVAVNLNVIERAGAWYKYKDQKFQGKDKLLDYIRSLPKAEYDNLLVQIIEKNKIEDKKITTVKPVEAIKDNEFKL